MGVGPTLVFVIISVIFVASIFGGIGIELCNMWLTVWHRRRNTQALWWQACADASEVALVYTVRSEVVLSYTMGSDTSDYIGRNKMCWWGLVESKSSMPFIGSFENAFFVKWRVWYFLVLFSLFFVCLCFGWLVGFWWQIVLDRHRSDIGSSGVQYDNTRLLKKSNSYSPN